MKKNKKERLDLLLVKRSLFQTRSRAQAEILAGNVLVNGEPLTKAGISIDPNSDIRVREKFPYVSRGALKLIHAIEHFGLDFTGKVAIDVGASTGGFTEVMLERGARLVYAVDSGTHQLAWKLRRDSRVVVMERTNARYLLAKQFDPTPNAATVDVSFISLTHILLPLKNVLTDDFFIVILIKPQFELQPNLIASGGVAPKEYRESAVRKVLQYASSIGLNHSEVIESPIAGAKSGNIEYLCVLRSL